jgi:hypothetical protein
MASLPCRASALAACAALGAAIGACGTTDTKSTPDQSTGASTTATAEAVAQRPKPRVAGIGDTLTLEGSEGLKMRVTLLKVIDPVTAGEFEAPGGNKRLVGIRIAMENISETQYDDSPSNGSVLIYGDDEQADATILAGGECSSSFASQAKIAPGARRQGCIPFEVPKGDKLKQFQFTLDSGFGPQAGEWSLREASAPSSQSQAVATQSKPATSEQAPPGSGTDCGNGVFAGPNTSCPFALSVHSAWQDAGGSPDSVRAFSPVTNQSYTMHCDSSGGRVTCTGGNNASVTFDG